jgi:hypothetical protein
MPNYYAYHVDKAGHFISRAEIHADDDEQAIEKAKQLLGAYDIEVWCLARKLGHLKHRN